MKRKRQRTLSDMKGEVSLRSPRRLIVAGALAYIAVGALLVIPASSSALSIVARISDQTTEVSGGDRLYFDIEIKYPENVGRKDLRIEYQIREDGQVVASEKVLRAVETQASFLDYIIVPKSTKSGMHDLHVVVEDYAGLHKEVSASFHVQKGIDQLTAYFFVLLGAVVLVGILVFFQIHLVLRRIKEQQH